MNGPQLIPPITSPLGRAWEQPAREAILDSDDSHVLMTGETFHKLAEYSTTIPSGVYDGKMWKRHNGIGDPHCQRKDCNWLLCWYGPSTRGKPNECSINTREILLLEGALP